MGGEGSGESLADPDPKGQVTLTNEDTNQIQENLQILYPLESPENKNKIEEISENENRTEDPKQESTPALMNCSNLQFNFKKNDDEEIFTRTTPSPKR